MVSILKRLRRKLRKRSIRTRIDPAFGLTEFQARQFAYKLITDPIYRPIIPNATELILSLYNAFIGCDCSLVEINPLAIVETDNELDIVALDSKVNLDDNSLWRHSDIAEMRDPYEEDPSELEASESGLSYIRLDGDIGCMVNGAGLAMATMDIIKQNGGEPANFLDVGGGASVEAVAHAFRLILADENVKAVLVNIFGGIMKMRYYLQTVSLKQQNRLNSTFRSWSDWKERMWNSANRLSPNRT